MSDKSQVKRDDNWEQLLMARASTARTGIIIDAQKFQLSMWGKLAFQHADQRALQFAVGIFDYPEVPDEPKKRLRLVEYRIKSIRTPGPAFKKVLAGLVRSIRTLLGPEFTVSVLDGGKPIFLDKGTAYFQEKPPANVRNRKNKRK